MDYLFQIAIRFVAATVVGASVPTLVSLFFDRNDRKATVTLLGTLALVGASAGIAGGMSRTGVVGDIVPAFLALLGVVAVYLFGVDRSRGVVASLGAVALSLSLVTGYALASQYRNSHSSDYREIRTICADAYTDPALLSNHDALQVFEEKFKGYCPDVLKWHVPR